MRIPHTVLPALRLTTVVAFAALCAIIFGYLWAISGGRIPLITASAYEVEVPLPDVDNLVDLSDVRIAGVPVGKVREVRPDGARAMVRLELDGDVAPLHEGVVVQVKNKTLIEETYLELTDGAGAGIADGATLPETAGRSSTQVDDVLASLDPLTRDSLRSLIQGSGAATQGRARDVGAVVGGLGDVGREGGTSLIALAEQSDDLRALTTSTGQLLAALDTRRGQIAQLVTDSQTVFGAVSESKEDLENVVRKLPPVLTTAREASRSLHTLSGSLAPVAANLREAAPQLSAALQELPATSADLRGLLPSLDTTLDRAPDTLTRVPTISRDVRDLVPTLQVNLADLNPALGFLSPYGRDIAGFFVNFAQTLGVSGDENGRVLRLYFLFSEQTPNLPVETKGLLGKNNAIPMPGASDQPSPGGPSNWQRLEREPIPR